MLNKTHTYRLQVKTYRLQFDGKKKPVKRVSHLDEQASAIPPEFGLLMAQMF